MIADVGAKSQNVGQHFLGYAIDLFYQSVTAVAQMNRILGVKDFAAVIFPQVFWSTNSGNMEYDVH